MICYTDGACSGNPGRGGYGVVCVDEHGVVCDARARRSPLTTNNREEMKAILYVMLNYGNKDNPPIVYTDSAYAYNTFTSWMYAWAQNYWIKSDKREPENLDLIKAYYNWERQGHRIELRWVRGHVGITGNEMADKLATGKLKEEQVLGYKLGGK